MKNYQGVLEGNNTRYVKHEQNCKKNKKSTCNLDLYSVQLEGCDKIAMKREVATHRGRYSVERMSS